MAKLTANLAAAYGVVASDLQKKLGDAQAAQAGPPVGQKVAPVTNSDRVDAWNARDPKATDEAMMQAALETYPQHLAAFKDPEKARRATAEDLTHMRYAKRIKLYTYGAVGYKEQVEQAEHLARLARRSTTPDPPPPPASMPTAALTNAATTGTPVQEALPVSATGMRPPAEAPTMPEMPAAMAPAAPSERASRGMMLPGETEQGVGNGY